MGYPPSHNRTVNYCGGIIPRSVGVERHSGRGATATRLVEKLINTRFEPSGFTDNPQIRFASSLLDYVGRLLGGKFISSSYLKLKTELGEGE